MSISDLQGAGGGATSMSITDFDGDEEKPDPAQAPPAAARPTPPPARPRPRGRPVLDAFPESAESKSELREELSSRLDKIDDKLDWIISRAKVTVNCRHDSNDDTVVSALRGNSRKNSAQSSVAFVDADPRAGALRRSADGGPLLSVDPPAVVSVPSPAGPGPGVVGKPPRRSTSQDSLDRVAAGSQPVTHQISRMPPRESKAGSSGLSLGMSLGTGVRGSNRAYSDGGTLIPNLNKRPGQTPSPWSIPGRSGSLTRKLRGHGSGHSQSVPTMFKNQFLARRMYEKSASKDLAHVQQRIQSLPKAMRSNRYQVVDYIYTVLDDPQSSKVAWWTAFWLQALVLLSVLFTFMQAVEDPILHGWSAAVIETLFDLVFLTEVCTRWCCAPNRVNFFFITQSWIDIAAASAIAVRAAVGFVLPQSQDDSIAIFLLCFVPIIRLLKIIRHFETFNVLIQAVKITMEALPMLMYAVALITMTFAALIYILEPDLFESPFRAVWFCLVTVTTVGYGDYSPVTTAGITIVMVLIVLGVILMAVPMGIIGMQFNEVWNARDYSLLLSKTRARLHQWGYTAHDIPTLFKIVDYDDNGVLELDEFCELVKEMKIGLSEDRIVALFEHMDRDGSGALDAAEFALEVFPDTFVEAFGHVEKTDFKQRASLHWMTSLAATINNGASRSSPFRRSRTVGA